MRVAVCPHCAAWLLLVILCGCHRGPVIPVTGEILVGGAPAAGADVIFDPMAEGAQSIGRADASGKYELYFPGGRKGALVGKHVVSIRYYLLPDGKKPRFDLPPNDPNNFGMLLGQQKLVQVLPAKYSDEQKTELRAEVSRSRNTFDYHFNTKYELEPSSSSN